MRCSPVVRRWPTGSTSTWPRPCRWSVPANRWTWPGMSWSRPTRRWWWTTANPSASSPGRICWGSSRPECGSRIGAGTWLVPGSCDNATIPEAWSPSTWCPSAGCLPRGVCGTDRSAPTGAGAQIVRHDVGAERVQRRGEYPTAVAAGDGIHEPTQPGVLAEHEHVDRRAVPGQRVHLQHGRADRLTGRRPAEPGLTVIAQVRRRLAVGDHQDDRLAVRV